MVLVSAGLLCMSRRFAVFVGGLIFLAILGACGDDGYPADLRDADYDLAAMAIQDGDVAGYVKDGDSTYSNDEYSLLFDTDVPESKKRQLDARGRVSNFMSFFSQEPLDDFARPVIFYTSSTLFEDTTAASDSVRTDCGLPIDDRIPLEEFGIIKIGDESSAFTNRETDLFSHVSVCFRTGRVVHAVVLRGPTGTEDIAMSVRLAQQMLERVDEAFAEMGDELESDS